MNFSLRENFYCNTCYFTVQKKATCAFVPSFIFASRDGFSFRAIGSIILSNNANIQLTILFGLVWLIFFFWQTACRTKFKFVFTKQNKNSVDSTCVTVPVLILPLCPSYFTIKPHCIYNIVLTKVSKLSNVRFHDTHVQQCRVWVFKVSYILA